MTLPVHIHETLPVQLDAAFVADQLRTSATALSTAATADALHAGAELMRMGGFRARALPTVETRSPTVDELGHLIVRWRGDEETTGWPDMTIWVLALPNADGTSTLALLSAKHPGYDLSTGRVDKVWRDRLARTAVRSFGSALRHLLEDADRTNRAGEVANPEPTLATLAGPQKDRR